MFKTREYQELESENMFLSSIKVLRRENIELRNEIRKNETKIKVFKPLGKMKIK